MTERVTVSVDGDGVADVRLNRPDKLNALDLAMFDALAETGDRLAADTSVRAVVLSGEGRSFCAGLDVANFTAMAGGGLAGADGADGARIGRLTRDIVDREPGRITNLAQQAVHVWRELPQPVVAAIAGHALGGGLQLALGADLRIAAPDARLSVLEIRWGLVPDMTGTAALVRLVGDDVAKELTFTGRMVSGEEAARLGLVTRTAEDPHAAALELAREIAGRNPDAIRAAKRLLNRATDGADLPGQLLEESRAMGALIGSPNQTEAVVAYFEKRPPVFGEPRP
ncbi:crotonase/enoyl-CoA hydratase family protein [Actinomadura viridis]|uniref:Enoyl-CoA hydratase/carnithine racemase n=1 Tax=Actinomadura viridis TaxID=58110 RepID=A0A931GK17_9ACTN|nr:crotonase/enoyl-CoA hydratase family protein [Actinomadura viridis]MBG6090348.1 enoyl-CoA hydratase/carnithine racemase [Actinomadura viridis]